MSAPEGPGELPVIGFVGLGNMGWPMARNLHAAGFTLVVRDSALPTQERFVADHPGVTGADSPGAFAGAGIVVTMLPDGGVVRDVLLRWPGQRRAAEAAESAEAGEEMPGGIGAALRPGALILEMSSSDPSDTLRLARDLEPFGVRVVDAPVSGGVSRAVAGELSVMVGGAARDVARAQPVLRVLGDPARQFATGALGTGHAMKALNNVVAAATYCATAEAVATGRKFGLDPGTMIDIISASTGRSFVSETVFGGEVLTGSYRTGFKLGLMAKDVRIAAGAAAAAGVDAPVLALTQRRWAAALGELGAAADQSRAHQSWWDEDFKRG